MRVLGKPELSNAIKLADLEVLMSNFGPPSPREYDGQGMTQEQQQHLQQMAEQEQEQEQEEAMKQMMAEQQEE